MQMVDRLRNFIFFRLSSSVKNLLRSLLSRLYLVIADYGSEERREVIDLIRKIKNERETVLNYGEAYSLYMAVKRTEKIKGDLAEVGVYKGGSAKLICEAKGKRKLHLFDTFLGIPSVSRVDAPYLYIGMFKESYRSVRSYLRKYKNVFFYRGMFPDTARSLKGVKFAFVHIDVDTHKSTKDCLQFFYTRLTKGGAMLIHDYNFIPGVRKAVDVFFSKKPEPVFEISGSQCMVVKI